jgi:hypothetical protein
MNLPSFFTPTFVDDDRNRLRDYQTNGTTVMRTYG